MGIEIERKFLVVNNDWKQQGQGVHLCQGYICSDPGRIVRVRIEGERAVLTIKGKTEGISRGEWEYPIPIADAKELLSGLCAQPLIEKFRYRIDYQGLVWEVDEFLGDNAGLVVAEVELQSESQEFARPAWLGAEVSHDHRYANANLLKHPFRLWSGSDHG
ncbi:CYTH domain-containing protein [Undibacterium sp. Jales W-56]|uniref:CYTH domain-containing protein n=1 Tax=Undibacterium sp. Jales W-56 TaxID=2897325 RepID=UPI0021CE5EA2|nr:CYTH domain-containing protein [Undibacterium sp. Jales W-56]MCU6435194.1 CYTH domain-containing protein [Undibacterium sp. Jales W-56]